MTSFVSRCVLCGSSVSTSSILKSRTYTTENAADRAGFDGCSYTANSRSLSEIWRLYVLVAIGIVLDQRVGVLIPDSAVGIGVVILHYRLV
jgi:hypothetical protein